jgi:RNA polymerase sigma-70 factor, ECF subfamily
VPTRANGHGAVAAYLGDADGRFHAHSIQVCAFVDGHLARVVAFQDESLFATFGLSTTAR